MKISEITVDYVLNWLGVENPTEADRQHAEDLMAEAYSYIKEMTGFTDEEIDARPLLTQAYLLRIRANW